MVSMLTFDCPHEVGLAARWKSSWAYHTERQKLHFLETQGSSWLLWQVLPKPVRSQYVHQRVWGHWNLFGSFQKQRLREANPQSVAGKGVAVSMCLPETTTIACSPPSSPGSTSCPSPSSWWASFCTALPRRARRSPQEAACRPSPASGSTTSG